MKQWYEIKKSLGDEILFCRVGDFYELFFDDATIASKILDIQLTKRKLGKGTYPLAGVPVRSLENYVTRLVSKGHKVAIMEQLEDAKVVRGKKTITRGLTRIISKGTITEDMMLTPGKNNYLGAITQFNKGKNVKIGFAVCDLSTGDFRSAEFKNQRDLIRAYTKFSPVEILFSNEIDDLNLEYGLDLNNNEILTEKPGQWFEIDFAKEILFDHFNIKTVKGFGIEDSSPAVSAAGALLNYLITTQQTKFPHITSIKSFDITDTMTLDSTAIKGLELFENNQDHTAYASLFNLMNETVTPIGSRQLRHWMANPLAEINKINERLNAVTALKNDAILLHTVRSILKDIGDIERLTTRISIRTVKPYELIKLAQSLENIPDLKEKLKPVKNKFPNDLIENLDPCTDISTLIRRTIVEEPGINFGEGKIIKLGINQELDRLISIMKEGKSWLTKFIEKEQKRTGLKNIRIKQNNVMGYFIEISKREVEKVPEEYIRKQIMINVERYFTEELKNWESEILSSEIKIQELETSIYNNTLQELSQFINILQTTANQIADIDCLSSFSYLAERRDYCKPQFNEEKSLTITGGRHPVIESINQSIPYVPNDIILDYDKQRLMIITGPNFSGKSSLLRATALIVIMAQMGSFVPAANIDLGVIDRIFTRIGASDNLVAGQSTFMLEMIDAANLVNNCTERSLIIADELGRGTSTYDGLAIAWSISEYLHNLPNSPKAMLATHYHQLSELEDILDSCANYHFEIRFEEGKPKFNHELSRGSSDRSFGVEVAKLAGIPELVIQRARKILELLESQAAKVNPHDPHGVKLADLIIAENGQTSLDDWFGSKRISSGITEEQRMKKFIDHPVVLELGKLSLEKLTPLDALNLLEKLKKMVE
ncbi:MAG: DNA mismatch repair protein MutS [Candidatus Heimdallarchaeota archaeon LC_2]|nr:MAG: DNA mismatch repair protein MutS [Candidatus Heimdallarchaeota archaeon LC_2]